MLQQVSELVTSSEVDASTRAGRRLCDRKSSFLLAASNDAREPILTTSLFVCCAPGRCTNNPTCAQQVFLDGEKRLLLELRDYLVAIPPPTGMPSVTPHEHGGGSGARSNNTSNSDNKIISEALE